ncbi:MAG TPA: hypothetical protein PLU35_06370 [Phycisphaerales bacterium]|nr:hypothetical protein [Phycisphaerales bacterium]
MSRPRASFNHDKEAVIRKLAELLNTAKELQALAIAQQGSVPPEALAKFFEVRTSGLNLLACIAGESSIYYRMLHDAHSPSDRLGFVPGSTIGILTASMNDFREGFMVDAKLLVSAEVLADFLVQAEVLLERDYKDAAAVIIRAVLEDGLRRLCVANNIETKPRDGIKDLAKRLAEKKVITTLQYKEIDAKKELGNDAARGRFDRYTTDDVIACREFVLRLLADVI